MDYNITRRTAIGILAGCAVVGGLNTKKGSNTVLRIAHLTDVHVDTDGPSSSGLKECLYQAQTWSPDFIFNGGDAIGDAFDTSLDRSKAQWDNWNLILRDCLKVPIKHCVGNHDVCKDGKDLAIESLKLDKSYYSFEQAGWKFIVLDSTFIINDTYLAKLDDVQFAWLEKELDVDKPIMILSHIPILSCCVFYDGDNERSENWSLPGKWMHLDSRKIKNLFYKSGNVKLCLSGHIHMQDIVDYLGTVYICGGAVSGAWWNGKNQECDRGYGILDLQNDGNFSYRYINY